MKMDNTISYTDVDQTNLEQLLETFGSVVTLEDIASAYAKSGRDLNITAEILCNIEEKSSSETSEKLSMDEFVGPTPKTVSETSKASSVNVFSSGTKPLISKSDAMKEEVSKFLFGMLGNGFNLNMNNIKDVVELCDYDVKKSMEMLLDLSSKYRNREEVPVMTTEEVINSVDMDLIQYQKPTSDMLCESSKANSSTSNKVKSTKNKKKSKLENDLLKSLFTAPERREKDPEQVRTLKEIQGSRSQIHGIKAPKDEPDTETKPFCTLIPVTPIGSVEEEFEALKKASKEYWNTMIQYYTLCVEAYINEDFDQATKYQDQGHFFMEKARAADEKAGHMLTENNEAKEDLALNLLEFEPKEAINQLKVQLHCISGISTIQHLRLTVGDSDPLSIRRKRLIGKLLEKESITWSEEENGSVMVIRVCDINPKNLSFKLKW